MPKVIDYPRGSLKHAIEIAKAVQELGGSCSIESCADHLGKKVSGSFRSQVSAAIKYNFIKNKKGSLLITPHFKTLNLSYDEEERLNLLRESFFRIPVFKSLYERFRETKLPIGMLDKLLIREFEVADNVASRVANYFIDAAREAGLLNSDNTFSTIEDGNNPTTNESEEKTTTGVTYRVSNVPNELKQSSTYVISITGPNLKFQKELDSQDDFIILEAIINTIKKKLDIKNDLE